MPKRTYDLRDDALIVESSPLAQAQRRAQELEAENKKLRALQGMTRRAVLRLGFCGATAALLAAVPIQSDAPQTSRGGPIPASQGMESVRPGMPKNPLNISPEEAGLEFGSAGLLTIERADVEIGVAGKPPQATCTPWDRYYNWSCDADDNLSGKRDFMHKLASSHPAAPTVAWEAWKESIPYIDARLDAVWESGNALMLLNEPQDEGQSNYLDYPDVAGWWFGRVAWALQNCYGHSNVKIGGPNLLGCGSEAIDWTETFLEAVDLWDVHIDYFCIHDYFGRYGDGIYEVPQDYSWTFQYMDEICDWFRNTAQSSCDCLDSSTEIWVPETGTIYPSRYPTQTKVNQFIQALKETWIPYFKDEYGVTLWSWFLPWGGTTWCDGPTARAPLTCLYEYDSGQSKYVLTTTGQRWYGAWQTHSPNAS